MPEILEQPSLRQRDYERFAEVEYQRQLTDELTEASEKLAMVMHNPFEFEMREDGELYFQDGSVGKVLRDGVIAAEAIAMQNPQFMTELIRRRIELQEYDDQRRLALGSKDDPDVLVVLSPIPDAAVSGVDFGAYDKDRMKTLVRVFERTERGIRSTSISLDGTDRSGLQAIARQFGQTIQDDDGSEDILAMRFWGYTSVLNDPVKTVRRRYDEQLERQRGGAWYGGRQDGDIIDALSFIAQQSDIIEAHMKRMAEIGRLPPTERKELYKEMRYAFAAALDERKNGETSYGGGVDLDASGAAAHDAGKSYDGDCPTGEETAQTAEQAIGKLYGRKESEMITMTCPYCGLSTYGDPCAYQLVCTRCNAEVRGGKVMSKGIGRQAAIARETAEKEKIIAHDEKQEKLKREMAKTIIPAVFQEQNSFYEHVEQIGIGGMVKKIREISRDEWYARRYEMTIAG